MVKRSPSKTLGDADARVSNEEADHGTAGNAPANAADLVNLWPRATPHEGYDTGLIPRGRAGDRRPPSRFGKL